MNTELTLHRTTYWCEYPPKIWSSTFRCEKNVQAIKKVISNKGEEIESFTFSHNSHSLEVIGDYESVEVIAWVGADNSKYQTRNKPHLGYRKNI